jgi:hypothetical protein
VNIEKVVLSKYPNAIPNVDFLVVDRLDGNGAQIVNWILKDSTGADVPQPSVSELSSLWLPIFQQEKIDELNNKCNETILSGFSSNCLGTDHTYQFDYDAQANLTGQLALMNADSTISSVLWKTTDAGVLSHSKEQFLQLVHDAFNFKNSQIGKYWNLKSQVLSATTEDVVKSIVW